MKHSLSVSQKTKRDRILLTCRISSKGKGAEPFVARVDTGAEITCISQRVVDALGLVPCGVGRIVDWEGEKLVDQYCVDVQIFPRLVFQDIVVERVHLETEDVLIGMDILSRISFSYGKINDNYIFSIEYND